MPTSGTCHGPLNPEERVAQPPLHCGHRYRGLRLPAPALRPHRCAHDPETGERLIRPDLPADRGPAAWCPSQFLTETDKPVPGHRYRLVLRPGLERRLTDSVETALRLANGVAEIEIVGPAGDNSRWSGVTSCRRHCVVRRRRVQFCHGWHGEQTVQLHVRASQRLGRDRTNVRSGWQLRRVQRALGRLRI